MSFEELVRDSLAYSKAHKRSYNDDVYRFGKLRDWFGNRPAESITPQDIERRLAADIQNNAWAPATANRYRSLLSLAYRLGMLDDGKLSTNSARLVKRREENNERSRWLTVEEEGRPRKALEENYADHIPEFDIGLYSGMRHSEMYWRTGEDVNFSRKKLPVPRSKHGKRSYVRLNRGALAARRQLRSHSNGTSWMFRNERGGRLTSPRYWFEPAIREAKIKNFHWHDLRHTFASRPIMGGADLKNVMDLMVHKSISMTVRYTRLDPSYQQTAVESLLDFATVAQTEAPTDTRTSTKVFEH